jgi:osmotically-inducible protein OsmY
MRLLLFAAVIGLAAYALRQPRRSEPVEDDVLIARVRTKLDQLVEHPGSVNIEAHDGRVTLTGPVAERELRPLKRALRVVPGVRKLDCRLTTHASAA